MLHSGGQCGPEYFIQPECFFWGLDIVAKIMNKYFHMELGKAMSLSGMCVALSAALVYDKKTVVLSVLGTYFNGIVLDHFIFDHNIKRRVCIITKRKRNCGSLLFVICTVGQLFTKQLVLTIWKKK